MLERIFVFAVISGNVCAAPHHADRPIRLHADLDIGDRFFFCSLEWPQIRADIVRSGAAWAAGKGRHHRPASCIGSLEQRSEEHTSELQSLMRISYAVFCLKKKNKSY